MQKTIDVKGVVYRFLDLENELSFEQAGIGRKLYADYARVVLKVVNDESLKLTDTSTMTDKQAIEKLTVINDAKAMVQIVEMFEPVWTADVLALMTTVEGTESDISNYESNKQIWRKAPYTKIINCREAVKEFVAFFTTLIPGDFHIFQTQEVKKPNVPIPKHLRKQGSS